MYPVDKHRQITKKQPMNLIKGQEKTKSGSVTTLTYVCHFIYAI